MRKLTMIAAIGGLCLVSSAEAAHVANKAAYSVATIDYPGFRGTTTANGISNSQRVVGAFSVPSTQYGYGFIEFQGRFALLPSAPCRSGHCDTTPLAINSQGEIAGEFSQDPTHRSVFVLRGPLLTMVSVPGTRDLSILGGLNERGEVVGFFQTDAGPIRTFLYNGLFATVLPAPAGVTDMAGKAISNSGQITGSFDDSKGLHGFLQTRGQFSRFDVPGAVETSPVAINSPGDVIGTYAVPSAAAVPTQHGFLMVRGRFTRLDFPGGLNTTPTALNDAETVVGTYENPALRAPFNTNAFVYQRGTFTRLALPGAVQSVGAISASGTIVGTYFDASCPVSCSVHGFTATAVGH